MAKPMTSKERVRITLACGQADRVPINYSANPDINRRLMAHFGLARDDYVGLALRLGKDFSGIEAPYVGPRLHPERPDRFVDPQNGRVRRYIEHDTGGYMDFCDFPLIDADEQAVADWPLPTADDYDYSGVRDACRRLEAFALNGAAGYGDIINGNGMLRGMEQTLVDLITDNPAGLLLADRRMDLQIAVTERILEAADGGVDHLWLGEDLGTQIAPIISMDIFRRHIRPRYRKYIELAKAYGLPVIIHTCGSSSWAYEDFIEMGIGAVDALQPEAADMSPAYLKKTFGGRLAFHGCISTAGPVATGTPEETTEYCRKTLDIMMPGGGYCFSPTHQLQDNSPTENVVAMYEAARTYGVYD